MRERCRNPRSAAFKDYGGRGITLCDRWRDYQAFLNDMGECPEGLSLDRIDNDRGYEPDNCRWANRDVQRRNSRRVTKVIHNDQLLHLKDAADAAGVTGPAVYNDLRRNGGTIQDAFDRVIARRATL